MPANPVENLSSGLFTYSYIPGAYQNQKIVITALSPISEKLLSIDGWNKSTKNGNACSIIETMPPVSWIKNTSIVVHSFAESIAQTDKKLALNILADWRRLVIKIAILPRVILTHEPEEFITGNRRKKRYLYAACGYKDVRMREVLKCLGFTWDRPKYAHAYYGYPNDNKRIETILSEWNKPHRLVSLSPDLMHLQFPYLKREQEESISFLVKQWAEGWHGALDADDMGIGKTLTALVFGRMAIDAGYAKKIIVVANLQTVPGWIAEWNDKLTKGGKALNYTGQALSKAKYKDPAYLARELDEAELIVTNYECLKNDDRLQTLIPYCKNAISVFDEATKCANPKTGNFQSAVQVSLTSSFAVGLTGTPLSKNIFEAWSIFRLLDPFIYPSEEFYPVHMVEKEMKLWIPKYKKQKIVKIPEYHYPEIFHKKTASHFIRHEKDIESMDAEKIESRFTIEPNDSKLELSTAYQIQKKVSEIYHKDINWDKFAEDGIHIPQWQISAIGHIQSALDDPYILYSSGTYLKYLKDIKALTDIGKSEWEAEKEVRSYKLPENQFKDSALVYGEEQQAIFDFLKNSDKEKWEQYRPAKVRMLSRLLNEQWSDKKAVVFCSFSRTCDRVAELLAEVFPDRTITQIKGSMDSKSRENSVDVFRESGNGIIVCTDAMAFGSNLQFADALVHYNIPWLTSVWKQRTDRIFRTGSVGRKDIVYLTLDHPLEKRKINLMEKNLKTIKGAMGIEMTSMPLEERVSFNADRDITKEREATAVKEPEDALII